MIFPSIFDRFEWLAALRGAPAVYLVLLTAVLVILIWDWRFALLALAGQYLFAGAIFVELLDPRLATVKFLTGWFICLILYFTGRQVAWGRAEPAAESSLALGPLQMPRSWPVRAIIAVLILLVALLLAQWPPAAIPAISEPFAYANLAAYALIGLGLLGFLAQPDPFPAGMGLLLALSGFELIYSSSNQDAAMLTLLAAANFVIAVVMAYLVQHRHYPYLQTE